jgi:hypothetical protein
MRRLLSLQLAAVVAAALSMAVPVARAQCTGGDKDNQQTKAGKHAEKKGSMKGRKGKGKDIVTGKTASQTDAGSKDAVKKQ